MKAQLPIVIAFIIVTAILISTTVYLSTIPVNVKYSYTGKQYSNWIILDHELTQLLLYMLRQGVSAAYPEINSYIKNKVFTQTIGYIPIDAPLTIRYWFTLFNIYVPTGKEFVSITPKYYTSTVLSTLSNIATSSLNATALKILNNWITTTEKLGLRIVINKFSASYNFSLNTVGTTVVGKANASINFTLTIFDTLGEYRVFEKTSLLHTQVNFTHGLYSGADSISGGFILPITIQSYLEIDGTRYYYMISPHDIRAEYYSPLFSILPCFSLQYGGTPLVTAYVINNGKSLFYRGNGVTNVTLIIRYTTYDQFLVDWIKYVHFSSIIDLIKSTELDWNNVFYVFNYMTWNLNYDASTNLTGWVRIYTNPINTTSLTGNNVEIVYSQGFYPLVNYTKVITFYVPGIVTINVNGVPILVPTQYYIHYNGKYYAYYTLYTLSFNININSI